jgi:oligoribonuclease (3'-5' exoribonuclease)
VFYAKLKVSLIHGIVKRFVPRIIAYMISTLMHEIEALLSRGVDDLECDEWRKGPAA